VIESRGMQIAQVMKQDDGWYCEFDSKVYPSMVRRYVMLTKCVDATGELNISIFNEQVCLCPRPLYVPVLCGPMSCILSDNVAHTSSHISCT